MRLYFAYGSNMWDAQMARRCPQSRKIGVARLRGYRWIITARGYASVVESAADEVEGVLFEISQSDEESLDRYEGVAAGVYGKAELRVRHDGREELALVYVDSITAEGPPKEEYIGRINAGLADANLSEDYVARQVRRFIPQAGDSITIARAALTADVSRALIAELNAELSAIYPEPGATHFGLDPGEVAGGRGAFLVVYRDGTPVGCGALRLLEAGTGELKRMYMSPRVRGTGLGRRLVAALEAEARALGVRRLVLETGIRQTAALALYRATGFRPIPLYGEYLRSPETSICLGKELPVSHA